MPITEVVLCPLVPGSDVCGSHEAAGAALRDTVDGLHRCSGCQQFIAGMQLENVDMMEAFITWESLEKYHEFRKTPDHGLVVANLIKLRIQPVTPYHVEFRPFTAFMRATEAPVTEVATFYFDGSAPTGVLDRFTRFREVLNKQHVSGVLGAAAGLSHEELESEGVKGTAAVLLIGWESVDAHMAFQKTELFKNSVGLLPVTEAKRVDMVRPNIKIELGSSFANVGLLSQHHTSFAAFR
ncbi:hypothetical protein LTR01_003126 [Friedmanniomyces endolithicus]|nr:hypothetical protein LTR01_003126 [Friedmanniomyces endolithicus]KAK0832446.1 hypothetical protein LTR73_002733 [Friedmanniomyces endolithicus]